MERTDHRHHRHRAVAIVVQPLLLAVAAVLVLAGGAACSTRETQAAVPEENMKVVVVPVGGMSCSACAASIKKTLTSIDGVAEAEVSLEKRNVRVKYAPSKLAPSRLVAAINGLGYQAGTPAETR
jgi:copper chaperone